MVAYAITQAPGIEDIVQAAWKRVEEMQTPFLSVFMYLDEVPEGRTRDDLALIIEEVLEQRIQGVKNEAGVWVTPTFPKLLYVLDEDNIYEDSKYYYLTELAAKCTAKRMVPDYISAKKMRELKGDVYGCMGCRSFLTPDKAGLNADGSHKYYGRLTAKVGSSLNRVNAKQRCNLERLLTVNPERAIPCQAGQGSGRCRDYRKLIAISK